MDTGTIANIIAGIAVFVAVIVPVIQIIYGRRNEWHIACELLFHSLETLYPEISTLIENPQKTNHITYQYLLKTRQILFKHYANKFILQRKRIRAAENVIYNGLMEITLNVSYETILLKESKDHKYNTKALTNEIHNYILEGCNHLVNSRTLHRIPRSRKP
ncbi:MAG: hypothetical protein LBL58_03550 [Tannerellaceae bacterium]|jgi:hypothetical protein|nr:hypothetical protein [Tannerellaceae bacterium]